MNVPVVTLNRGRGSGAIARNQVRALLARGHNAYLLHSGEPSGGLPFRGVRLSSRVLPVHEYLPIPLGRQQPVSTMDAEAAAQVIDDFEAALVSLDPVPDLLIGHHANATAVATHRAAERLGIPYVVFAHGTGIEPRYHGGYADAIWQEIDEALRAARGIIVTTEFVRDELVRPLVDLPAERFQIIPGGVDLDAYQTGAGDEVRRRYKLPHTYVISPGAVTELKGAHNVAAASRAFAAQAPTIFLGDGDLRESLQAELGDRGRFLGFVPEDDKVALINCATLLVAAPVKLEHFGMVYAEALAAGTVPVAYDGGGVRDIVTPEVGVLTDRNPRALGEAVRRVLEEPERRRAMAEAGRRRAETHFDQQLLGDRFVDWIETID